MENHKEEFEKVKGVFKSETQEIGSRINENDLLDFLEEIFEGKVENNTEYKYKEWEQEAKQRYENFQPPGYEDKKDKENQFTFINGIRLCKAYGDFFLWKEMHIKEKDPVIKEVILVTNDQKEDWVYEAKGKKIGARVELVEEMMRLSSASFRIYSTNSFLYHTLSKENYESIEVEASGKPVTSITGVLN